MPDLSVANRNIIINALRLIASQRKARHGVRLYLYDGFKTACRAILGRRYAAVFFENSAEIKRIVESAAVSYLGNGITGANKHFARAA